LDQNASGGGRGGGGSVSVMVNGEESSTFKTGKDLRQRDLLSSLIFNLVGDVLTKMLKKAWEKSYQGPARGFGCRRCLITLVCR
jgi:hypothetical protein